MLNEMIERLKQGNWVVNCKEIRDAMKLLSVCQHANITWKKGKHALKIDLEKFNNEDNIGMTTTFIEKVSNVDTHEDITKWFFDCYKKLSNNEQNYMLDLQLIALVAFCAKLKDLSFEEQRKFIENIGAK